MNDHYPTKTDFLRKSQAVSLHFAPNQLFQNQNSLLKSGVQGKKRVQEVLQVPGRAGEGLEHLKIVLQFLKKPRSMLAPCQMQTNHTDGISSWFVNPQDCS